MTQRSVERLIGMLATDEALRAAFIAEPGPTIDSLVEGGWELQPYERLALERLDRKALEALARQMDPRVRKANLRPESLPKEEST